MPIRRENRSRYPDDWADISARIRFQRAKGRCECDGRCKSPRCGVGDDGRCEARNAHPHPVTTSIVVLTVAHLDHTPEHCSDDNLLALCQACHLSYDKDHHAQTRRETEAKMKADQMSPLF